MQENLVIVESPAKAKTIEKFLGKDFIVKSSFGHIRDLGEEGSRHQYRRRLQARIRNPRRQEESGRRTRESWPESKTVWLASDEDREGEAIAWHLYRSVGSPRRPDQAHRLPRNHQAGDSGSHREAAHGSIWTWSTPSRRAVFSTGWSASSCRPCCGRRSSPALSAGRVQTRGRAPDRGARARDHRLPARRPITVSWPHCFTSPETTAKAALQGRTSVRRFETEAAGRDLLCESCNGADIHGGRGRARNPSTEAHPARTVHHFDAAAGGGPQAGHVRDRRRCPSRSTSTSRV